MGIRKRKRSNTVRYSLRFFLKMQESYQRGSVVASITHACKRIKVPLGITYVDPNQWEEKRQRMKGTSLAALDANSKISDFTKSVEDYFESSNAPSLIGFRREVLGKTSSRAETATSNTVLAWFDKFIANYRYNGKRPATNTLASYRVTRGAWETYERHLKRQFNLKDLRASNQTQTQQARTTVEQFDRFLAESGGKKGEPLTDNSRTKYLKILKTFLRWTEKETGQPLMRDFTSGGQIVANDAFTLTVAEREAIENLVLEPNNRLYHVHKAMIMALYTGLRFSEWRLVNPALWQEASQRVTVNKGGKTANVIHRDPVRNVLKEYAETGWSLVLNNNAKVNELIKEVAKRAGLTRKVSITYTFDSKDHSTSFLVYEKITTHTLRRSKATLDLDSGMTVRDVSIETAQSEEVIRRHYDRPNIHEYTGRIGVSPYNEDEE